MNQHRSRLCTLVLALVGTAALAGGCSSNPSVVSEDEMRSVRASNESLRVGMSQEEALGQFKGGNQIKLASTAVAGMQVEEWKVEARLKDKPDLFARWLYFANGKLVDVSDRRLDYRGNEALVNEWKAAGGGGGATTAPAKDG